MGYGFAFVVIAFGAILLWKGYKGYAWAQVWPHLIGKGTA